MTDEIPIVGAGPAGLAAAITLAKAGCNVIVYEAMKEVGSRFQGDYQGLENWTTIEDVVVLFKQLGINIHCLMHGFSSGIAFDAKDKDYQFNSDCPIFYMVERGPGKDSLDTAMLNQALELGVKVQFNSQIKRLKRNGILAAGPKKADAIAVGYHFETDMKDGFWVICNNHLAPNGYSYLLVMKNKGTVKSCMFSNFKQEKLYVQRTVEAFQRLVGLKMNNPVLHGGAANFRIPLSAYSGLNPLIGEQAGFQDALWGFGMRLAITSGILAAKSLLTDNDYDESWKKTLKPQLEISVVNRSLYSLLGNRGYGWLLNRWQRNKDVRETLRNLYRPTFVKNLLLPWANFHYQCQRHDIACNHIDCYCVWCRCKQQNDR